jgi:hypothetical protein
VASLPLPNAEKRTRYFNLQPPRGEAIILSAPAIIPKPVIQQPLQARKRLQGRAKSESRLEKIGTPGTSGESTQRSGYSDSEGRWAESKALGKRIERG